MKKMGHFCIGNILIEIKMDRKKFYEAPVAQAVELRHESAVMQVSLTSEISDYGLGITDEWEDGV